MAQRHPAWAVGFADEVWWSRVSQPSLATWCEADQPTRLVEQTVAKDDPDPKALACYGLLLRAADDSARASDEVWLRFVAGRPISRVTTQFLAWCTQKLAQQGKKALLLVVAGGIICREIGHKWRDRLPVELIEDVERGQRDLRLGMVIG